MILVGTDHPCLRVGHHIKLLQIKCHVLESTKGKAPKDASKDNSEFCGSVHLS
jgi:hypothetical protein